MAYKFTDRAQKVLRLANQEAQQFCNENVGTEYLLLGIIKEGTSIAADVLKQFDIGYQKVCQEVEKFAYCDTEDTTFSPEHTLYGWQLRHSPRVETALAYARKEAHNLGHHFVGTAHILLGLLREEKGVAAQILESFGLQLEHVRQEVLKAIRDETTMPKSMHTEKDNHFYERNQTMETKLDLLDKLKWQLGEAKLLKLTIENHLERLTLLRQQIREVLTEIDPYTGELRQVFDKLLRSLFDPIRERIIVKYVPANNDVEYKRAFDKKVAEIEAYLDSIANE